MPGDQLLGAGAGERAVAGEQLVEHHAERVDVAALVHLVGRRAELLGRRVQELAEERPAHRQSGGAGDDFGDAEVDELDHGLAELVPGHHDVVGRNVPVDDPLAMEEAEPGQRLTGQVEREPQGRGADPLEHLLQRDALDVFHDDEAAARLIEREVVHLRDVRVAQLDRHLGLAQEPGAQTLVGLVLRPHDLDDADLVEQAVAHLVDRAHAPLVQLLQELVLAIEVIVLFHTALNQTQSKLVPDYNLES